MKPNPNYAQVAARDRAAFAIARETGLGFSEAMRKVFDAEEVAGKPLAEIAPAALSAFREERGREQA